MFLRVFAMSGREAGRKSQKESGFEFLRKLKFVISLDKADLTQLPNSGK